MLRFITLILFPLLLVVSADAAPDTGSYMHFDLKSGFPSNNVYSLIQDKNNYLWFATDHGLVKYNGYTTEIYNTENGGLPDNDVYELYEDKRGRIWLRTFSEKFGYIKNGVFKAIHFGYKNTPIRPQYFSESGSILYFLEYTDRMANMVFIDDDVIKTVGLPMNTLLGKQGPPLVFVSMAKDFKIDIWTRDYKIHTWDYTVPGYLKFLNYFPRELSDNQLYGMYTSAKNEVYAADMSKDILYYFQPQTGIFKPIDIREAGAATGEKIYIYNPESYAGNYAPNTVIISNAHLYTYGPGLNFIKKEKLSDLIPSDRQMSYRFNDKDGELWYTTNGDGAWYKPSFYNFNVQRRKIPALRSTKYLGSVKDKSYWWNKAKLEMYGLSEDGKTDVTTFKRGVELKSIVGNDSIAYISSSSGLYKMDVKTGAINTFEIQTFIKPATSTNDTARDKIEIRKHLYYGNRSLTYIDGVLYTLVGNGFMEVRFSPDTVFVANLETDHFSHIYQDEFTRKLYIYSIQTIYVKDLDRNTGKKLNMDFLAASGINTIRQIEKDKYGNMFILGDKDLYIYDEKQEKARKVKSNFSWTDAVLHVKGSELYVAGTFGMAFASIKGLNEVGSFSILPNVGTGRYNRVESFVLSNNTAILNTNVEVYSFSLDSLKVYARAFSRKSDLFSLVLLRPSEQLIKRNDTFKYKQAENIIKLDAINSFGQGTVKYTYRINGAEKWEQSSSGEIFLASLAPGKYHRIDCLLSDEVWKSDLRTFYIYRYPFWWQTNTWRTIFWVTGTVLLILLILVVILITRYYTAKKEEKKKALTELELRAIHAQINPHFIFNTLSAALFFINKKRFDDAYTHVNKFSKLLRAYLKSSQDRYVILGEEIAMLRNYIELQQIRFEEKFEYNVSIDNKLPVNNIQIPSLLLQPLVENAINHGLFHRIDKGQLDLKFLQGANSSELICIIEDNGVGRDAATKINAESSTRESYGTKLTNKLLEVFRQYEHMDITLDYTDKAYPETGTVVTLTLKNLKYVT